MIERVKQLVQKPVDQFSQKNWRMVDDLIEARNINNNERETLALTLGFMIREQVSDHGVNRAVDALMADPLFKDLDERDVKDFVKYFVSNHAESLVFAPDVIASLIRFAQDVGFPTTLGGAVKGGLKSDRYSAKTLLNVLVGAHVLTVVELDASDVMDYAKQSSDEYHEFKDDPEKKVDVYEWDPSFLREVRPMLRALKLKEDQITKRVQDFINEKRAVEMAHLKELELLESKIQALLVEKEEKEEPESEEDEEKDSEEFFKKIDDDMIEDFIDGVLVVLGKLEQNGQIPRIETPSQAKNAVIAVVRRMYQKRGLISKLSTKYSRFGSKRELKKARSEIGKALS